MMYILGMCEDLKVVWTLFGYVIWAIKVVVPLLLIISGMITMAKAVMEKDEKKIKDAQNLLIKKVIAAVIVYLVITVTKVVIGLVATGGLGICRPVVCGQVLLAHLRQAYGGRVYGYI